MTAVLVGWFAVASAAGVEGTWRLEMSVLSVTRVPVLRDATTTASTVGLVTVRADGAGLVHEQRTCAVDLRDDNPMAVTTLPDALVRSLPPTVATVDAAGGRYVVDLGTSHLGYDPARSGGALPAEPSDPSVVDAEGDGRPGATVRVQVSFLGDVGLEVVQRSRAVLEGAVDGDVIRGGVRTVDFEQRVLRADHPFLRGTPAVRHDDAGSTFVMTRLPEGATCADALAAGPPR